MYTSNTPAIPLVHSVTLRALEGGGAGDGAQKGQVLAAEAWGPEFHPQHPCKKWAMSASLAKSARDRV